MDLASVPVASLLVNVLPGAIGLLLLLLYARLMRLRSNYRNAFARIELQLTHQHEGIAKLVEHAKGGLREAPHPLERVMAARNQAARAVKSASGRADGDAVAALAGTQASLEEALQPLLAVMESHPALTSDAAMPPLRAELTATERRLTQARQDYNAEVEAYNTRRTSLPDSLVAGILGFRPAQPWVADTPAPPPPVRVSF